MPTVSLKDHKLGHRQRLRDRLLTAGQDALADYEILETILFLSQPRGDVKPLAKTLLQTFGTLTHVFGAPVDDLKKVSGMGDTTIATLKSIQAVALRMGHEELAQRPLMNDLSQLIRYCRLRLVDPKIEQFQIFFLNKKQRLIREEIHQVGTIDHSVVYPREVIKKAMDCGASQLLLVHNHPSGDPSPSLEDIKLTQYLVEAGAKLDIFVKDHIVLGVTGYCSFRAENLL
jgi:DNA repair protein RadC